jgi:hypothetical protein
MNLWIDTRGLSTALTLFGVPPLERLRRTIGKLPAGDRITLSGDASARFPIQQHVVAVE